MNDENAGYEVKPSSRFVNWITRLKYRILRLFQKSNYMKHFERELKILRDGLKEEDGNLLIEPFIRDIKRIIRKFSKEGHSGGSAPYGAGALSSTIKNVLLFKPLGPITGADSEWHNTSGGREVMQNIRLSSVFKDGKDGRPYFLDAVVFVGNTPGSQFTSGSVDLKDGRTIGSRQFIRSFPFRQKTFYIDVLETEWADKEETIKKAGGGWWTSVIKDESQLKEVEEYYDVEYQKPKNK